MPAASGVKEKEQQRQRRALLKTRRIAIFSRRVHLYIIPLTSYSSYFLMMNRRQQQRLPLVALHLRFRKRERKMTHAIEVKCLYVLCLTLVLYPHGFASAAAAAATSLSFSPFFILTLVAHLIVLNYFKWANITTIHDEQEDTAQPIISSYEPVSIHSSVHGSDGSSRYAYVQRTLGCH
uniref:Uncharacterized protein n=1 Tax=Trichogramma kaykai TaxID=54128 RepID=A0ABD2WR20_9HYME